ncbi:MAG: FKBP-type peptidyl-prolyl cis-trans isomerase [Candidatus Kaiserbacteria bacterium]|nr:FKBP-type peptidyl-prolyl cis-trans isomerase [Candidatus Kaiserbacteria bacterium]
MNSDQSTNRRAHKWIAVTVAVAFFLFFFFGGIFFPFPRLFILDLFGTTIGTSQVAVTIQNNISDGEPPSAEDIAGIIDRLQPVSDPNLADAVRYLDVIQGSGDAVVDGDTVRVGYVGMYLDENTGEQVIFDSNLDPDSPFQFTLGSGFVIPGFEGGIIGMRRGGQRLIRIEPSAGYGSKAAGSIPPDTTLIFVIELYGVN